MASLTRSRWIRSAAGAAVVVLAMAGCSKSAQTYVERGDAAVARGDIAAAVLEYRNAVEQEPRLAAARQKLAEGYLRQGNGVGALAEYIRVADLVPNDVAAQMKAGSLLLLAGRFEDARARADKALAADAKNVEALVLRANALAGLADLDGALEQMQQAVSLDPRSTLQSNLGAIQAARGNLPEAETAFRTAVSADPKSAAAQLALGQFLWSSGKPADAEAAFKTALALDPANGAANRWLAAFYLRSDRAAEAESYFRNVVEVAGTADAALALADYYVGMNRPADAMVVLETLSTRPRDWAVARAKVASLQLAEGKSADALRTVNEVLAREPDAALARLVRARLLLADGRADDALRDAQETVKADPRNAEAHFVLGTIHEARRDLGAAATAYGEVLRVNPRASTAQVRLAMIEMQRNALPAATQLAEQAAAAQPGDIGARLVLARSLLARGDLERSTAVTQTLVDEAPGVPVVQNQVGMLAMAKGDRAGARAAFEKALVLNDRLVEPLSALVSLDIEEKKSDSARARVSERLQKTPANSLVLSLAGRTWASTGDVAKGEEFLRRAIDADPANLDAYSLLAQIYISQRKLDAAVAEFDKLAARQPQAVGPPTVAALILQAQGKTDEARKRFERIVEQDSRAAVASNNLAWIYASGGEQLDRALQLAQAAKAEIPDHPEVNDTLAFVYLKKQLPALAIAPLRLALEKEPGNPSFHHHLGMAYAQAGDKGAARQSLEQALKLKGDFDGAADARRLLDSLGS